MLGELAKVGDSVIINIPDENWNNGYHPVEKQKGTKAVVMGFDEIAHSRIQSFGKEPGVYTNHAWLKLDIVDSISNCFVELEDQEEYKRRYASWNYLEFNKKQKPLRPLPELKFWEGDIVLCPLVTKNGNKFWNLNEIMVVSINYSYLNWTRNDGSPMPEYDIGVVGHDGCTTAVNETDLTLVRRGNVWKYFNGEKPVFADLKEEVSFFHMLGHSDEVRNPATQLYKWTLSEALEAIREGTVDAFTGDYGFLGTEENIRISAYRFRYVRISAYRFRDRELGERVRAATLAGFKS